MELEKRTIRHWVYSDSLKSIENKAIAQFGERNVELRQVVETTEDFHHISENNPGLLAKFGDIKILTVLMIHWDRITIENEEGKTTEIKDLFCELRFLGKNYKQMRFTRTTLNQFEWDSKYVHSHLPTLDRSNPVCFSKMCLGSGPINHTIYQLRQPYYSEENLDMFFWELDKIVHVESLAGVPYIRMDSIHKAIGDRADIDLSGYSGSDDSNIKAFCKSFFSAVKIPLGFERGKYVLGCSKMEFALMVTNYWNKYKVVYPKQALDMVHNGFIERQYILNNGCIYFKPTVSHNTNWRTLLVPPITFKGEEYPFKVLPVENDSYEAVSLIDFSIVMYIQRLYLTLVNMKFCKNQYGKEKETKARRDSKGLYSLLTSRGICWGKENPNGASTEDTFLLI